MVQVRVKRLRPNGVIPTVYSDGAAGADVHSTETVDIAPGQVYAVKLGIAVEIPEGYELQLRPRSGLAIKHKISVLNSPGTVDSDFRGEMMAILMNHGKETFRICAGDRIAQLVLNRLPKCEYVEVAKLADTVRGTDGFGSTGVT